MIPDPIGDAVRRLREGGLIAYPTETVWALGADVRSDDGVDRLRRWKGRSSDPISVLVADASELEELGFRPGRAGSRLVEAFWPGPLTVVIPCDADFAGRICRDDGAVGVRCSSHPLALAIARRLAQEGGGPMTATSLNHTGEPSARTREDAERVCADGPDAPHIVEVERAEAGGDEASTVIDCAGRGEPGVLRWGALTAPELRPVLEELSGA